MRVEWEGRLESTRATLSSLWTASHMTSYLLYFRNHRDVKAILAALAEIALAFGYINHAGPNPGAGNVAELLAAIANGELALILLPDEQRDYAIDDLNTDAQVAATAGDYWRAQTYPALARALAAARQREQNN